MIGKLLTCALFLVGVAGCGSSSGGPKTTPSSSTPPAPAETTSTDTLPCQNFSTKYPGDDVCIQPPAPGTGYQFHYGPSDWSNDAEVQKYVLAPGQEITDCVFFMVPNTTTVYFQQYHARMRPSSHHMLLYLQSSVVTETMPGDGPRDCAQGLDSSILFGAQTQKIDIEHNPGDGAENKGMAAQIRPNQQAVLQAHFVNAGSTPIMREVWANMLLVDPSKVTQVADFQFLLGGLSMNVPMGSTQTLHASATVPQGVAPDFRVVMMTGHYHAHTTKFTTWATVGGVKQQIFEEYGTLGIAPEPKNWYFTSETQNTPPDPVKQLSGANYTGVIHMSPGDTLEWDCVVDNNNVQGGIKFANAVYTGEMCNLFGMYAPAFGATNWRSASL